MKKNIKQKRRLIALIIFFLLLFLILFLLFRKKDYSLNYKIEDYNIKEEFDKDSDYYFFEFTKEDKKFSTTLKNQHFTAKKIVYQLKEYSTETETCLEIYSNQLRFYPLCTNEKEQLSFHLVSEEMKKNFQYKQLDSINDSYESIQINSYFYKTFYIWNYHGFYRLNDSLKENISLFSKDIYDPKLIYQVDNLLFIPDYESNYYFNKAYILDLKTGKYETWNLENAIYFDSVILGSYEKAFYLVDKHEKKEWKISLNKKKMEQIGSEYSGGKTYQNGFVDTTMNKLINQDMYFTGIDVISYKLENGLYKTYQNNQELIKKESPKAIVNQDEEIVYYLVNDSLYCFTEEYGEIKLLTYFEWNFNYNNVIFIY